MQNSYPRMHASFYVSDLQKTTDFYNAFFGIEPTKTKPKYVKYTLEKPSLVISFIENKARTQPHFGHLGFQVETLDILNQKLAEAKLKNLTLREEMGTNCCYAYQDKFWVNDPDGIQWEVYYFHADSEFNDPHYEMNESKDCCEETTAKNKTKGIAKDEKVVSTCC